MSSYKSQEGLGSPRERAPLLPREPGPPRRGRTMSESPGRASPALHQQDLGVGPSSSSSTLRTRTFSTANSDPLDLDGCSGGCCCHPQALFHRIISLVLMCLLGFGSFFCFDNPGALQSELKESMNITTAQFANLYSWYSWPNVILPVIGGFLMDRIFGIRLGTMLFAFIIILGQLLFSLGGFLDRLWVMELGRFVFGIGGESLAVAQNTYAVSWFKGKELNMVFGFQLSVARVGSTVNFLVIGPLFNAIHEYASGPTAIGWTLLIAGSSCLMSFLCSVVLAWMDKRRNRLLNIGEPGESGELVKITDVQTFPLSFWFLCLACLAYYGAIFPFVSLAKDFFRVEFGLDGQEANFITGLIYLVSAPASPLLGLIIDKTGRNITWVFMAVVASIGCHLLLAFTRLSPYVAISALGLSYSLLASALWPIAALLIPEYQLGTAYGLMQAIQNLGTALIIMAAGAIADGYGYFYLELFFLFWLSVSLLSTICMWICDCSGSGYLNMSIGRRKKFDDDRLAEEEAARGTPVDAYQLLRPRTDTSIRNRYLYKVGATLPGHLGHGGLMVPAHLRS